MTVWIPAAVQLVCISTHLPPTPPPGWPASPFGKLVDLKVCPFVSCRAKHAHSEQHIRWTYRVWPVWAWRQLGSWKQTRIKTCRNHLKRGKTKSAAVWDLSGCVHTEPDAVIKILKWVCICFYEWQYSTDSVPQLTIDGNASFLMSHMFYTCQS